jgi:outer membrane immunogenic protein
LGAGVRTQLLASTALTTSTVFIATTAWAAPPTPRYTWTGCYVGANAGAAFNHVDNTVDVPGIASFATSDRNTSFTGGGGAGCNLQFDPHWVVGLEGDFNYLNGKAGQNFRIRFNGEDTVGSQDTTVRWLATLRGRFGYAWDRSFLYATGGFAFGDVRSSVIATRTDGSGRIREEYTGSYSSTRTGWTIGGGFEYLLTDRLSAKFEYLHYDLGDANYLVNRVVSITTTLPATWNASASASGDIVRVGLNYRLTP